ncbi:hypothetical protein GCM10012320_05600 [Sinomonas cellulolyticus]|nr:hypothetical protein GCM10012320_05600 [Sinomonas sp. KCTC 49339]
MTPLAHPCAAPVERADARPPGPVKGNITMTIRTLLRATTAALAASAALALTGCAGAGAPAVPAASHAAASVTVSDAWAKAAD